MEIHKVFISYSWQNQTQAEKIFQDLTQIGIKCIKDNHALEYKDSISDFMVSIRDTDFAIILLSDSYLTSKNCMSEAIHLLKEREFEKKCLPVILPSAKFYRTEDRLLYLKHWEAVIEKLKAELKNVDVVNSLDSHRDLKITTEIAGAVDSFLGTIASRKNITYNELIAESYASILKAIGYEDFSWAIDLIAISNLKELRDKEFALDAYMMKYPLNTFFYTAKGLTCAAAKKFEQAMLNYEQAINLSPENAEALNNTGWLFDRVYNNKEKAKEFYLRAIESNKEFSIARLNLGVLFSSKFGDANSAKAQYDTILSYDPKEARAHNNLGNLNRGITGLKENTDRAIKHFKKAIELDPTLVDAYINLANIFKLQGNKEEGNKLYRKAKRITDNPEMKKMINLMIKSDKG